MADLGAVGVNLTLLPNPPAAPVTTAIKTVIGLSKASVKTINAVAIASVKTVEGLA